MTRNIQATDAQGNKVSEPVQINGVDPTSSGGGGGAFEDTDGDSVAELQDSHADFQGGDARNIGSADADDLGIGTADFVAAGDFVAVGPSASVDNSSFFSTTSTSYVHADLLLFIQWSDWLPAGAQGAVYSGLFIQNSAGDARLQNVTDAETIHEVLDVASGTAVTIGPTNYAPTTTASPLNIRAQIRTNDGATSTGIQGTNTHMGVQL